VRRSIKKNRKSISRNIIPIMSLKERGVAVLLAAENAETIEPTAK
jgi:hypothetical protein